MKRGIVSGYSVDFPDVETGALLKNNYGSSRPSTGKKGKNIGNTGGKSGSDNKVKQ